MTPDNEPIDETYYLKGPDEFVKGEKKHPDFNEWMKTKEGENCMKWPVSEPKYLHNRLFWAFDAGRNCVWDQYLEHKEENTRLRKLIETYKQILERANDKGMFYYDSVIKEIEKI